LQQHATGSTPWLLRQVTHKPSSHLSLAPIICMSLACQAHCAQSLTLQLAPHNSTTCAK
jgi:hypothetical protein